MAIGDGEPGVAVIRDGSLESLHRAHAALIDRSGRAVSLLGDGGTIVYPRSSLKPLQALALQDLIEGAGATMSTEHRALASASHAGADSHQIEAASMLAEAGVDESALQCPPAWPVDDGVRQTLTEKTSLSHNCSGKHAAMIWASVMAGFDPASYLDPEGQLQKHIAARVQEETDEPPRGPGIDGCGAPAWRCSLSGLAHGFAKLASATEDGRRRVRDAMTTRPVLVGGVDLPDTNLMLADGRVVAKRGADGVMACGFRSAKVGTVGLAVKIEDGSDRAAGPLMAALLHALGAIVPTDLLRTPVLGGGVKHGEIAACGLATERIMEAVQES